MTVGFQLNGLQHTKDGNTNSKILHPIFTSKKTHIISNKYTGGTQMTKTSKLKYFILKFAFL